MKQLDNIEDIKKRIESIDLNSLSYFIFFIYDDINVINKFTDSLK